MQTSEDTPLLTPDILFIGGGVAGCAGASAFHKLGRDVLLIERESEVKGRFKGEYLQPYAVQFFRDLGFDSFVNGPDTVKIRRMRFRDIDAKQNVISETIVRYPVGSYAAVLPNKKLVAHMRECAKNVLQDKFILGASIEPVNPAEPNFFMKPEFVVKLASGKTVRVRPQWVIGSDGRQSTVRKWIGGAKVPPIGPATLGSPPEFIVGTELNELPEASKAMADLYEVIRSDQRGTLAIFKLTDNSRRCYWSSPQTEKGNSKRAWQRDLGSLLKDLSLEKGFNVSFEESMPELAGASADTTWLGPAARGRFLLTGDALAITTPFGGQGMTCAVRHMSELTRILEFDLTDQAIFDIGERYSRFALKLFNHINLINFGLYYLFFAQNRIFKSITAHILRRWKNKPELTDRVGRLFGGIDQDTPGVFELMRLWGIRPKFTLPMPLPVPRFSRPRKFTRAVREVISAAVGGN